MKKVKLTKVDDHAFNGKHPNNVNVGFQITGEELSPVAIGERYYVGYSFSTSAVKEIINETTFKSTYSTYKIEYINQKT